MPMPRVPAGLVAVELVCPRCGVLEVIAVGLSAVLTTPTENPPTLAVKAKATKLEHWCQPNGAPATLFSVPAPADTDE